MDTCEIQQSLKRHFEAVKQHLPEIQDLIAEMLGLYYRSSLSDDEIPDSGSPTILSDQVKEKIKLQIFEESSFCPFILNEHGNKNA